MLCDNSASSLRDLASRRAARGHIKFDFMLLGLGESLLRAGLARRDEGDAAGAAADWRRADVLLERSGALRPDFTFLHACCHSSLSWAAGLSGSSVPAGEAEAEALKALALLQLAAATGSRDPATYRNETALDPLRD